MGHSMGGRMIIASPPTTQAGAGRRCCSMPPRRMVDESVTHPQACARPQSGQPPAGVPPSTRRAIPPGARRRTRGLPAGHRQLAGPNVHTAPGSQGAARSRFRGLLSAAGRHAPPPVADHRGTRRKDVVVPFANARPVAERADATLYRVPGAPPLLDAHRAAAGGGHDRVSCSTPSSGGRCATFAANRRIGDDRTLAGRHARAGSPLRTHRGRPPRHRAGPPCRYSAPALQFGAASPLPPRRLGGRFMQKRFARPQIARPGSPSGGNHRWRRCTAIAFVTPGRV